MKRIRQGRMTVGDILLAAVLLLVALGGLLRMATAPAGARVVASVGERVVFTAPLEDVGEVEIEGPLGVTRLRIEATGARIVDSPCPLKVCMGMGPAHRAGDFLACVPNRVLVEVVGSSDLEGEYDLLSR